MRHLLKTGLLSGLLCLFSPPAANAADCCLFLSQTTLAQIKAQPEGAQYRALLRDADRALAEPLYSVTAKTLTPPNGDKHDYMSLAAYWWPDPTKADGLPWIRKDGQVNPASKDDRSDGTRLARFTETVWTLALAGYLSGREAYSERAMAQIRYWFFNPATRMNPNLDYAQGIPGRDEGRGNGILDGRYFATRLIDSLQLLRANGGWTALDEHQMRQWLESYLDWLLHSAPGKREAAAANNHGSWYALQVVGIAAYLKRDATVREMIGLMQSKLDAQLAANGAQPQELRRTRSFHYSYFNLQAAVLMATLAQRQGNDLWRYRTAQGSSLLAALDFMAPYVDAARAWPYPSLDRVGVRLVPLLIRADAALGSERYRKTIAQAKFDPAVWSGAAGYVRGAVQDAQRESWLETGRESLAP